MLSLLFAQAFAGPVELAATVENSAISFRRGAVEVTILAGNIIEQDADAAAFPSSVRGGGDELIVGSLLREGGAETGFQALEKLLKENSFQPGSVQIVEAGGGRFKYIVNAATQDYESKVDDQIAQVIQPGQNRGDVYGVLSHVNEQRLIAQTVNHLLLAVSQDSNINTVAIPMFGTGSFHGMHPLLSLISTLAGVEAFALANPATKPIQLKIVWYGRPGPQATQYFGEKVLPALEWGLQMPGEFETFLSDLWTHPLEANGNFEARAKNPALAKKSVIAVEQPVPVAAPPVNAVCDAGLKGEEVPKRDSVLSRFLNLFH